MIFWIFLVSPSMYRKTTEEGCSSFSTGGKSEPACGGLGPAGGTADPAALGIPAENLQTAR